MIQLKTRDVVIVAGWLACLPACAKDEPKAPYVAPGASVGDEAAPADQSGMATQQSTGTTTPSPTLITNDAQIVQIVATLDTGEIQQAQLAQTHARNPRVQAFAEQMIRDHTQSKVKGAELAQQAGVVPEPSDTSRALESKAMQTLQQLQNAAAAAFDPSYMRAQVDQHREVLNLLTDRLIPSARRADVKSQLVTTRSVVQHHLEMAMGLAQELQGQPPAH